MPLTDAQREQIARFVPAFRRLLDSYTESLLERQGRQALYAQILSPEGLRTFTELELGQLVASLWASRQWGNKAYLVEKLIALNGLPAIASHLHTLLWGREDIARRYDAFRRAIKGLGAASITELLAFTHPESCGLWNDTVRAALIMLGFRADFPAVRKVQISGAEYRAFNALIADLGAELAERHRLDGLDYLDMNAFLYTVYEIGREHHLVAPLDSPPDDETPTEPDFDHDETVEQIVNIGQWLGFQAEKEKLVARGAKVDAVWQARIANLGVVTYVFEVQRRGSVDSLILNLQRAQNNPTVQRLIIVAQHENIERIRTEVASLPESFRKSVSYMAVADVQRSNALIGELSAIIGKLELVRSEFGV